MNIIESIKEISFKINETVKIINLTDETANKLYLNKIGIVKYFNFDCGCGQTFPHDAMIGVQFSDKVTEEFWKEELTKI